MSLSLQTKIALIVTVVLWSSAFVGIRAGLEAYSPGGLALLRFSIASIVMYFIYIRRSKITPIKRQDLFLILLTGVVGIGLYNITLNYGEQVVTSGVACFIVSQSPILTALFAVVFLKERLTKYSILGMLISGAGVALITLSDGSEFRFYIAIIYVLLATLFSGLYSVFQKVLLTKYSAIDLTAYAIWSGTVILLIFIPDLIDDLQHASFNATLTVVYLGIFPAAIAYLCWAYVLSKISASRAVIYLYFSPIVATFIGWIWLGEVPTLLAFTGGVISLFGVWLVNQSYHKTENLKVSYGTID